MAPNLNYEKDGEVPVVSTETTKENIDIDEEEPIAKEDLRTKPFIIMVSTAAALGGLIFGYDIGGAGTLTCENSLRY